MRKAIEIASLILVAAIGVFCLIQGIKRYRMALAKATWAKPGRSHGEEIKNAIDSDR